MRRAVPAVVSLLVALLAASTADAACTSSTRSTVTFADSPADGDLGLAPGIVSVVAATGAACRLTMQDVLADAVGPGGLIEGYGVGIQQRTDADDAICIVG